MSRFVHFNQRVAERCPPGTDPDILARAITHAIQSGQHRLIERVMDAHVRDNETGERSIWRIRIDGQSLYVVVCDVSARPITILTQEQFRSTKAARKARRKREALELMKSIESERRDGRARMIRLRKKGRARK